MNTFVLNRFIIVFLSVLLCSTAAVAIAQEPSTDATTTSTTTETEAPRSGEVLPRLETRVEERTDIIEQRAEERAGRVETRQEIRAERQVALTEIRQTRILNLSANISNRMDAAIARLYAIVGRLETRIQKLTEAGYDTTTAATEVREAAEYLANAQVLMSNIDTLVFNATTSPTPLSAWNEVRATYAEVARLIRASHQSLRDSITLLKTALSAGITPVAEVPEETIEEEAAVSE